MTDTTKPAGTTGLTMAIDYAPLAVFFAVNYLAPGPALARIVIATVAFMIATAAAMIVSKVKLGRISPMLWISGGLVFVFGGLTIWFHDETFIKVKPTIVYLMFAGVLGFGLLTDRPLLRGLFGSAYPGLSPLGWRKLTRNWTIFFVAMAAANEAVWRSSTTDFWVGYKLWGAIPMTLLFAVANLPMLLRHGLQAGDVPLEPTPEG